MLPLVAVISLFLATCFSQQTGRQADRQTGRQTGESTTCYASLYRVRYELTNGRKEQDDVRGRWEEGGSDRERKGFAFGFASKQLMVLWRAV